MEVEQTCWRPMSLERRLVVKWALIMRERPHLIAKRSGVKYGDLWRVFEDALAEMVRRLPQKG